jgi:hypothetical protein
MSNIAGAYRCTKKELFESSPEIIQRSEVLYLRDRVVAKSMLSIRVSLK